MSGAVSDAFVGIHAATTGAKVAVFDTGGNELVAATAIVVEGETNECTTRNSL
jgi:hypothetical protein